MAQWVLINNQLTVNDRKCTWVFVSTGPGYSTWIMQPVSLSENVSSNAHTAHGVDFDEK